MPARSSEVTGATAARSGQSGRRPVATSRGRLSLSRLILILLCVALVAALGVVVQQYVATDVLSGRAASRTVSDLRQLWREQQTDPQLADGTAFAIVRVPRFGESWQWPVEVGTSTNDLSHALGWYPQTSQPGAVGNCALAGYRVTHGAPLARIDDLVKGDTVVVETRTALYTYALDTTATATTVRQDASWVLAAVPGHPGQVPTRALLTITTNQDLVRTGDRSVVFAHLTSTTPKQGR